MVKDSKKTIDNQIRRGRNCIFLLHVHLVFVTKYRKSVLKKKHLEYIKKVIEYLCENQNCDLKEFNGEQDHVHLLINYPPNVTISKIVNSIKGVSSRRLKQNYPSLKKHCFKGALWSPSYFAGSVGGATIETVKKYIENQKTPKN